MNNPSFSVVIPLYNKCKSIKRAVLSVLNQTYKNFELIVVDDGSTDNSLDSLNDLSDDRLITIRQNNSGVSSARNKGIEVSKNDFISFLDADDYWADDYLNAMMHLISDFPRASFYSCWFGEKRSDCIRIANSIHKTRGYINNYFSELLNGILVNASNVTVKKDCFSKVGLFDIKLIGGEDMDMWGRLSHHYKLAFEPTLLSFYDKEAENRACLKKVDIKDCLPYIIDLSKLDKDERIFYKKRIINRLIGLAYSKEFVNFFKLLTKHNFQLLS